MAELLSFMLDQGETFRQARLPSLYSDFQQQSVSNPDGFEANCTAWIDALSTAAWAGLLPISGRNVNVLSLQVDNGLLVALETKEYGRPLALGIVLDEALVQRKLILLDEFLTAKNNMYARTWAIRPWSLISSGFTLFGILAPRSRNARIRPGRLVIIGNVEKAARLIATSIGCRTNWMDRVFPMSMFRREVVRILAIKGDLADTDLSIILTHLSRDMELVAYNSKAVIFKGDENGKPRLCEQFIAVAALKSLIAELQGQHNDILDRIATADHKARQGIEKKKRTIALTALRSKKVNEKALEQKSENLSQVEALYSKIEQATDQLALVRVMQSSTSVLQNLHQEVGGVEKVEDVVEKLREESQKAEEVGDILQVTGGELSVVDADAVDEELESMFLEARNNEVERQTQSPQAHHADFDTFPNVPQVQPGGEVTSDERAILDKTLATGSSSLSCHQMTPCEYQQQMPSPEALGPDKWLDKAGSNPTYYRAPYLEQRTNMKDMLGRESASNEKERMQILRTFGYRGKAASGRGCPNLFEGVSSGT